MLIMNLIKSNVYQHKLFVLFLLSIFYIGCSKTDNNNDTRNEETKPKPEDPITKGPEVGSNFIVCEMENTDSDLGLWKLITPTHTNYFDPKGQTSPINETYLEFTGNSPAGIGADRSPLEYSFICPKTAKYELYMRMHQDLQGQPEDRCNDVYIKMEGNFTSAVSAITTEGLKVDEKFFGRGHNWGVGYRMDVEINGEHKTFPARYNLIQGEEYTLTISGRSKRTNLDYWILIDNSEDFFPIAQDDMAEIYDEKYRPKKSSI